MNLHSTLDVHLPIIFGKQLEIESILQHNFRHTISTENIHYAT